LGESEAGANTQCGIGALQDADALKHNFLMRGFFMKRWYEESPELTSKEVYHEVCLRSKEDFQQAITLSAQ
jgi:hypothetical protein